jgi:MFS family permease
VATPDASRSGASFRRRAFSSFSNRVYRLYFVGMLGQMAAMNMQQVVGSLLVYRLTGSAAILGAMSFAGSVPMIVLSLFGGVIADRFNKKTVTVISQAAFGVVSLGVALALATGYMSAAHAGSWWVLVVSSALQGAIMGLGMPARQAIVPEIVPSDQLMNAISLNTMGMNVLQLFAPAVAGFLVDAFNFETVYYVMTATYAVAVLFFLLLPNVKTNSGLTIRAFDGIARGMAYIVSNKNVLVVLAFSTVVVFLSMPLNNMMPVFVDDILHVGAKGMGILMSLSGAGAMVGSVILASLPEHRRGMLFIASAVAVGVALAVFAFSRSWPLSLMVMAIVGFGQTGRMTLSATLIQSHTSSEYMGRVMSIFMMQFGLSSLSTFAAGVMAQGVGVQWAIGLFAVALVIASVLALAFLPRLRHMD